MVTLPLVASDGAEAWELYERAREKIDLVLLDLSLPKLSGQEILSRIRGATPGARVVISTGHTLGPEMAGETLLRKPYRLREALNTIRRVLDET